MTNYLNNGVFEMNPDEIINKILNDIIDENHPNFVAVSDEEMIEDNEDHGVFTRIFDCISSNNRYLMKWRVYFGTPETVKTVFEPAVLIQNNG